MRRIIETLLVKKTTEDPTSFADKLIKKRTRDREGRRIVTVAVWAGKISAENIDAIEQLISKNTAYRDQVIALIKRFIAFNILNPGSYTSEHVLIVGPTRQRQPIPNEPVLLEVLKLEDWQLHVNAHSNIPQKTIDNLTKQGKVVNLDFPGLPKKFQELESTKFIWSGTISFNDEGKSLDKLVPTDIEYRNQVICLIRMFIRRYNLDKNNNTFLEMLHEISRRQHILFHIYKRGESKVWIYIEKNVPKTKITSLKRTGMTLSKT